MAEAVSSPIKDVSDTAFWVAYHRALETERADALFKDPWAGVLAGAHGRQISEALPTSSIVAWTVVLRTVIIDEYLSFAVGAGVDTVLCLGAGLDARPYRLALPPSLTWIEADYPHVIEYKETQLKGAEARFRVERVKIDLADASARRALFARVDAAAQWVLVLTEGVIPYLANEAVAALAEDLSQMRHARYWVADYFSPQALEYRRRAGADRVMRNAPFQFEPEDWRAFFQEHHWRVKQLRYFPDTGERLGRPIPLPLRVRLLARLSRFWMPRKRREAFRTFGGFALLERLPEGEALPGNGGTVSAAAAGAAGATSGATAAAAAPIS